LAEAEQDYLLLDQAHYSLGSILMDHGEFTVALKHLGQSSGIMSRCLAALARWHLGFPDQAIESIKETLSHALTTHNPENEIFAHLCTARIYLARREYKMTLDRAQSALDLAINHGLVEQWLAPMRNIRGWALAKLGQMNNGLEQMQQALSVFQTIGLSNLTPFMLAIYAEILTDSGKINEGLPIFEKALDAANHTGMHHYNAEIYRLKGETLLQSIITKAGTISDDCRYQEAESCFEQAIETARLQQAKSLELRAAASLARLLQHQNRHKEAHSLLLKTYQWFTEGHQTPDLQEARELLQKLS
jgi:tetratricopeptide (TPR) repeat protein